MQQMKDQFYIANDLSFLNFGSFGACPVPVMQRYQELQIELERDPVAFITDTGLQYLAAARKALAAYVNCPEADLVYIPNPTYGVNLIAKNLDLQAGDEILSTHIEYGACDRSWEYYCQLSGAKYIRQPVSFPIADREDFVNRFFAGVSSQTRLIFISQITSTTALILPVKEVIERAKHLGIPVFVDGAHVPGHIDLDIQDLDPDYYTGACHKWMMTPKGSSFLYVRKELQSALDPLIISWGYHSLFPSDSQFLDYHQMNGTRDYTAYLTIPAALSFMQEHNWSAVSAGCRQLCHDNIGAFCDILNTVPLAPPEHFTAQMFSAEIKCDNPEKLHDKLLNKYRIQIPVMRQDDKVYLRYSIQVFNDQADLDRLYGALKKELRR